ncbi:MAG: DUF2892 domain-containing protein [Ignavibacteriae bacterium]|nr:DUF2892 domain-containing protein [Ignavibacteriota bacterium]
MEKNIGNIDKVIRLVVGLFIIIYVGFYLNSWWGLVGIIPVFTVVTSRCLLYPVFKINTCKRVENP